MLSNSRTGRDENVEYYSGSIVDLIRNLKSAPGKNIYCDGGAGVVAELLRNSLIDKFIISVVPHLVGHGVRLFKDGLPEHDLKFLKSITFPSGLVQLWYEIERK
ncbi:MAG: dihydrofolate reductase family protein [Cytophagaceae bacterium]